MEAYRVKVTPEKIARARNVPDIRGGDASHGPTTINFLNMEIEVVPEEGSLPTPAEVVEPDND